MTYVPDAKLAQFIQEQALAENISAEELIERALRNEQRRIYKKQLKKAFQECNEAYAWMKEFDNIQSDEDIVREAKETRRLIAEGKL